MLLNEIYGPCCVQINPNVWLIKSVFWEWCVVELEVWCWVTHHLSGQHAGNG